MRNLSDTIARLKRLPRGFPQVAPTSTRLSPFDEVRRNPGQLKAWIHVPQSAAPGAPLLFPEHGSNVCFGTANLSRGISRPPSQT